MFLDPMLARINHSCDFNAYLLLDGSKVDLRSSRPIDRGEEIFIAYIDPTHPFHRRQHELNSRWFFTCRCTKCQSGPTLQEDAFAKPIAELPHNKTWQRLVEEVPQATIDIALKHPANYVADSEIGRTLAVIQDHAYHVLEQSETASNPDEAIRDIEKVMMICSSMALWPLHRQPIPAIRDALITLTLQAGDLAAALRHAANRYWHTFPKLYPDPAHPLRVVQTWQTAMTVFYIASKPSSPATKEICAKGADLAIIGYMLIRQTSYAAERSHGSMSSFTVSVRNKLDELEREIQMGGPGVRMAIDLELDNQMECWRMIGQALYA